MTRKIWLILFCNFVILFPVSVQSVDFSNLTVVEMIRELQKQQEGVVSGQADALPKQNAALTDIGIQLKKVDLSSFEEEKNFYALLVYLFNGGNGAIVENILSEIKIPESVSEKLVEGALAYARNRRSEFLNIFSNIDKDDNPEEKSWPNDVLLSIYLVTAAYMPEHAATDASCRLDYIRLIAPGSLFEEAAIRRQLSVAARLGDFDKLFLLVRGYAQRFSVSLYASDFWNELIRVALLVETGMKDTDFDNFLMHAPKHVQYLSYLYVARVALIDGRMERSLYSARHAEALARELTVNDTSARFYAAASQIGSISVVDSFNVLQSINVEDLNARDRLLFSVVQNVARHVIEPANRSDTISSVGNVQIQVDHGREEGSGQEKKKQEREQNLVAAVTDSVENAQKKLNSVDLMLKEQEER